MVSNDSEVAATSRLVLVWLLELEASGIQRDELEAQETRYESQGSPLIGLPAQEECLGGRG